MGMFGGGRWLNMTNCRKRVGRITRWFLGDCNLPGNISTLSGGIFDPISFLKYTDNDRFVFSKCHYDLFLISRRGFIDPTDNATIPQVLETFTNTPYNTKIQNKFEN